MFVSGRGQYLRRTTSCRQHGLSCLRCAYRREMKSLVLVLTLAAAGSATQQRAPISADEVTLRHQIYENGRVTIFLLDIPPGQATVLHRHDRDMLSVFVNGGRTRASFNGAALCVDDLTMGPHAVRPADGVNEDQILVAISDYAFNEEAPGTAAAVHTTAPGSPRMGVGVIEAALLEGAVSGGAFQRRCGRSREAELPGPSGPKTCDWMWNLSTRL